MRNYISILLIVLLLSSGCSKFLDRPLENKAQATNIDYTDLSLMYQPVSGVYRTAASGTFGKWISMAIRSSRSDDIEPGNDDAGQIGIHNFQTDVTVKSYWGINDMWISMYAVVIAANNALYELDQFGKHIPASDADKTKLLARYQAEVRFYRALAQFWLGRSFGAVPILGVETIDPAKLGSVGKSSLEDVNKYVMAEMDFCIPNLEDARPNAAAHVGGVTKYTALMLKAKAAMDLAGNNNGSTYWDVVLDCTNQIVNSGKFSLFSNYYQLFKMPGKLCDESILELQYSDFGKSTGDIVISGGPGEEWGNFFFFQGPENTYSSVITGPGWMVPTQKAVDFLKSRNDSVRLKMAIQYCGVNGAPGTYSVTPDGDTISGNGSRKKYFNGKSYTPRSQMTPGRVDYYGANNNVRIMRYAEALLMNAEAKIRKGQSGDAQVNLVRNRVKLASINGVTLQQLLDERHAELICEWWGERFNDLLRTDQAATVLPGFIKGKSEYIPIPQAQEDINSLLK
ncbi:RagB/SusD family nutrient uptake outer membrane protein [Chitinophaga polysaccharea]|uniref:RagB/SusD family nutrient uptake outer membrane protein n=1 Tax=Chitinophaga TaxID=79328 RepID=UPI001455261F|nr:MULTISPECIES: RagB/SusD family nutrient uptake outer membrane protein [Chitinophaga]NLR58198.1 RagB/SusD family nutrient uptake outer membrane protein [Chitinophaga polysaccharea]NLU90722.1 RagB/SusD family nutrient uptake outer membrane protein [Chitinophaga sp. Ak27]